MKCKSYALFFQLISKMLMITAFLIVSGCDDDKKQLDLTLENIKNTQPSDISSTGELQEMFKVDSTYTDSQRDGASEEITGEIVQWNLPVYEINKLDEGYKIQTSGKGTSPMWDKPMVEAFVTVYPRSTEEISFIENLQRGDKISFKGEIKGTLLRKIIINPSILVFDSSFYKDTIVKPTSLGLVNQASQPINQASQPINQAEQISSQNKVQPKKSDVQKQEKSKSSKVEHMDQIPFTESNNGFLSNQQREFCMERAKHGASRSEQRNLFKECRREILR